ncbi:hypothetical protein FHT39_000351 [Mitsuaria sp. BK045]|uniref:hypothetical protein n=1 Tax=unclassified Roseateles TaxID=2626991 RepID=UPI001622334D|nr:MULTISPECIES: hypothetical protein [unclassified Roseateles]MBB3291712.1 hypothetical protein [Mitsuaria sp. BK041]MBB3360929.1 hypothetical protein [Mitsuaria sp. BK045]
MNKPTRFNTDGRAARITEPLKLVPKDRPWLFLTALFLLVLNDQVGKWMACSFVALASGSGAAWWVFRQAAVG